MIKRPLIVGARGGMGRRYTAILRHLGITPELVDVGDPLPERFDGVLIATPTPLHIQHVERFLSYAVPILVEKPLATNLKVVQEALAKLETAPAPVDMVNQYRYLSGPKLTMFSQPLTCFNYWNHGRDGLAWDCISIVALAEEKVTLAEDSPIWSCMINGERLSIADMDRAYITMVDLWLKGKLQGHGVDYIGQAHAKVQAYIDAH